MQSPVWGCIDKVPRDIVLGYFRVKCSVALDFQSCAFSEPNNFGFLIIHNCVAICMLNSNVTMCIFCISTQYKVVPGTMLTYDLRFCGLIFVEFVVNLLFINL